MGFSAAGGGITNLILFHIELTMTWKESHVHKNMKCPSCNFMDLPLYMMEKFQVGEAAVLSARLEKHANQIWKLFAGELDHLPEVAFYMVGPIEDVIAKAEKLAEEL